MPGRPLGPDGDSPGLDVSAQQLLDEQRHAVSAGQDVSDEGRGGIGVEQGGDEIAHPPFIERANFDDICEAVAAKQPDKVVGAP
jgi:hypothetical protein